MKKFNQSKSKKVLSIKLQRRKQAQKSSQVVQKSLMKKKKKKMCRGRELKDVKRERALRRRSSLITHDEEKKKCTERERERELEEECGERENKALSGTRTCAQ